jgi:hypothetical protein
MQAGDSLLDLPVQCNSFWNCQLKKPRHVRKLDHTIIDFEQCVQQIRTILMPGGP